MKKPRKKRIPNIRPEDTFLLKTSENHPAIRNIMNNFKKVLPITN